MGPMRPNLRRSYPRGACGCWVRSGDPWPTPHRPDASFSAAGGGSQVLDELARVSKDALCATSKSDSIIGHADWEAQDLRFEDDHLAMSYDWDSLVVDRESVIVGMASAVFPARPESRLGDVPTAAGQAAFLVEYQDAAGQVFGPQQRIEAAAAAGWVTAYNARV